MKLSTRSIETKVSCDLPDRTISAQVIYLQHVSYERMEHFGRSDYRQVTEYVVDYVEYLDEMNSDERRKLDEVIKDGPYE